MKKLKSIISTNTKFLSGTISFCILFLILNVSVFAENSEWKEYTLKELIGKLKYYTYAKVAQSLRREYPANREQIWESGNCSVSVPDPPGLFFADF